MTPPTRSDVSELRAALAAAGAFDKREARQWARCALLFACFVTVTIAQAHAGLWLGAALVPVQTLLLVPTIMHGHDGAHHALSKSELRNKLMCYLCMPLLGGVSATWWRFKHNGNHHAQPNVVSDEYVDPDIILTPFATSQEQHEAAGPTAKWFHRHAQAHAFWPLTLVAGLRMQSKGHAHLLAKIREDGPDRNSTIDAGLLVLHYVCWLVIPAQFHGWAPVLGVYLGVFGLGGLAMAMIFVPGHVGMPVLRERGEFFSTQLTTSRNFIPPLGMSWFFVGLQYQIEHHLFPAMPYSNAPIAAPIVREWAQRHGLPYNSATWFESLADATRFLARAWRSPRVSPATPR